MVVAEERNSRRIANLSRCVFTPYLLQAACLAVVAGATLIPLTEASAQNFFGSFFGRPDAQRESYRSYAPDDRYSGYGSRPAQQSSRAVQNYAGGSGTYCVRLCDGRYFPIPKATGQVSSAKVCNAMCPLAATKVFNGSDPTKSVASDGTKYDDLDNALTYREKVVPNCSCTGNGPGGLARIDIESDPTLRNGDVVATATGLRSFNGSGSFPHKAADFTPIESSTKVAAGLRDILLAIRINNTVQYSGPVQSLAAASTATASNDGSETKAAKPKRPRVRVVVNPAPSAQQQRQASTWGGNSWGGSSWGGRSWGSWGSSW